MIRSGTATGLPKIAWALGFFSLALLLGGCGGGGKVVPGRALTLPKPKKPSPRQCVQETSAPKHRSTDRPPRPGIYKYNTKGVKALIGEHRRVSKLPTETEAIVTQARKIGDVWCYVLQRRYDSGLGDTATFIMRGSDTFMRSLRFQSGGYIKTLAPRRPILVLSGTSLDWSGVFRGITSGRYAANIIGRKQMTVGSKKVRVVGVRSRVSYGGDIDGWERSTSWVDPRHDLLIAENLVQQRSLGLDHIRLEYSARIKSLKPR